MSNYSKLTINGALMALPTLFDGAAFPDRLDKETLIDSIVLECGELGIYYTNPEYMRAAIIAWSKRRIRIWNEMIDTVEYEYNPIWNKDGVYTERRTDTRQRNGNETTEDTARGSGKTTVNTDDETIDQVAGYNSESWNNSAKSNTDGQTVTDAEYSNTGHGTRKTDDKETGEYELIREEHGNIGVTTTQQMIREQREIIDYDIYKIIADEFKAFFCILVY